MCEQRIGDVAGQGGVREALLDVDKVWVWATVRGGCRPKKLRGGLAGLGGVIGAIMLVTHVDSLFVTTRGRAVGQIYPQKTLTKRVHWYVTYMLHATVPAVKACTWHAGAKGAGWLCAQLAL